MDKLHGYQIEANEIVGRLEQLNAARDAIESRASTLRSIAASASGENAEQTRGEAEAAIADAERQLSSINAEIAGVEDEKNQLAHQIDHYAIKYQEATLKTAKLAALRFGAAVSTLDAGMTNRAKDAKRVAEALRHGQRSAPVSAGDAGTSGASDAAGSMGGMGAGMGVSLGMGRTAADYRRQYQQDSIRADSGAGEVFTAGGALRENTAYRSQGYEYKTDAQGRITEAKGWLRLAPQKRSTADQLVVGGDDRAQNDQGGHLIATVFGGSPHTDNLVAQNARFNQSDYKSMEAKWKEILEQGGHVCIDSISVNYHGDSARPSSLSVSYSVFDKDFNPQYSPFAKVFDNSADPQRYYNEAQFDAPNEDGSMPQTYLDNGITPEEYSRMQREAEAMERKLRKRDIY